MDNYTPNPSKTQPIYDPTRPSATPSPSITYRDTLVFCFASLSAKIKLLYCFFFHSC